MSQVTKRVTEILEKIKTVMVENNWDSVSCSYSGAGDSGEIDNYEAFRGDNRVAAKSGIDDLFWDLIQEVHPGFEINEGGFGNIYISRAGDSIDLTFDRTDYVPETETINVSV